MAGKSFVVEAGAGLSVSDKLSDLVRQTVMIQLTHSCQLVFTGLQAQSEG